MSNAASAGAGVRPVTGRQLAALRGASFGALTMLIIQFAIGIAVNLYVTVPAGDKGSGVFTAIGRALSKGPVALGVHAGLGLLIIVAAIALVIRSALARQTVPLVLSVLGLLAVVGAAISGARFVGSATPGASLGMALAAAVAMLCYAGNLLILGVRAAAAGGTAE